MSEVKMLRHGFAALRRWKIALLLYFATSVASLPVAIAFRSRAAALGDSAAGAAILREGSRAAALHFADFVHHEEPFALFGVLLLFGLFIAALQQTFLNGGVIDHVEKEPKPFFERFFSSCGHHFVHNVKLSLLFVGLVAVVVGVLAGLGMTLQESLFADAPPNSGGAQMLTIVTLLVVVIAFTLLRAVTDVARATKRDLDVGAWESLTYALHVVRRAPIRVPAVLLLWGVLSIAIPVALTVAAVSLPMSSAAAVAVTFLLTQLAVFWRCMTRIAAWGSIVHFTAMNVAADEETRVAALQEEEVRRMVSERNARERLLEDWEESEYAQWIDHPYWTDGHDH